MADETNPARRLYAIVYAARARPDRTLVRDVWADTLGCDKKDDFEITKRVVEVYALSQEVQKLLRLAPGINQKLYLAPFPKVDKAIFPLNLPSQWQPYKQHLSDGVLTGLEFCAEELGKNYSEEAISADDLNEIRKLVDELFSEVEASSIVLPLRLALLEELDRIRSALLMYRIRGAKGVKESVQALLGAVMANREALQHLPKDKEGVLSRLGKLIDMLDAFTERATKVQRILSGPLKAALAFLVSGPAQ